MVTLWNFQIWQVIESTMATLFLFRHTETVNTIDGKFRYNGFIDVDVVPEGLNRLKKYIPLLKYRNIKKIYSSDLVRAYKGAKIFADALGVEVVKLKELREVKQGIFEGLTYDEIIEKYPEEAKKKFSDYVNYRVKNGESLKDAYNRVIPCVKEIMNNDENVIIVAHGGVNMLILNYCLNMDLNDFFRIQQDFGCMNEIEFLDNFIRVIKMNFVL